MPSTKKRARSPEVDGPVLTHQSTSFQIHQYVPPKRRWCRRPKDDRIRALRKLERKRRFEVFQDTARYPILPHAHQRNTRVRHTSPAPVESPLQNSPGFAVPHSPPALPIEGDDGGLDVFNDSSVSPRVPLGSGLRTASSVRDNHALFRQTRHLDDHTPASNRRRNNQATHWQSVTIPRLIPIYLANRAATDSGRLPPPPMPNHQCQCNKVALKVEMVSWDRSSQQILSICECYSAGVQLVEMGYFPCAPVRPTLAFDINLLEFVTIGSHHMAPNVTGWSSTLQYFLSIRGYLVGEKDTIRRRFGNALHWYQALIAMADQEVDKWIRNTTSTVTAMAITTPGCPSDIESSGPTSKPLGGTATQFSGVLPLPFPLPKDFLQVEENVPIAGVLSIYLQRRCPICFSGKLNLQTSAAQAIVCVDANFAQRRRHSRYPDPVDPHPDTHFLSEHDAESMKRAVEHARPSDSGANAKSRATLPDDTLDDCEKAFTAAQGHIAKSSNSIFADTALMALLCRHDRPLFLVNMTSAGERQYYVLALIKALFQHLPDDWVIGLLYDVACQLERSMRKHGFLPEYIDRITFAVSVFHAFGHRWECQLVYHPRKSKGYGLSDGEGCERLWSAIRKMIPSLRSAGYWSRLFALDSQLIWFEKQNLLDLGHWVQRKMSSALDRQVDANIRLQQSGVPLAHLEREWKAQIEAQLASAPRQSKNIADRAITNILEKQDILKTKKRNLGQARKVLEWKAKAGTAQEIRASEAEVESLAAVITQLEGNINQQTSALGITAKGKLSKLRGNAFLRLRMNSLALRERIIQNLVARKFEMEKLERLVRYGDRMANHDHAQLKQGLNRRKGGNERLVKSYEKLRQEMQDLITRGDAPAGAIVPNQLASEKLWDLDVDDDLWMDLARDGQYQDDAPRWLYDQPTQLGIRAMVDMQRSEEELERLNQERGVMYTWLQRQGEQLQLASHMAQGNTPLLYQIELRGANLIHTSRAWNMNVNVGIGNNRFPEGLPAQMGPDLTDSRPPSVASSDPSDSHFDNEEDAGELWDELDVLLQAQEDEFIEQDEVAPTGALFDTPAMPIVKGTCTPMRSAHSFRRQRAAPSLASGPPLPPSVPSPLSPLSPTRPTITNRKDECQIHVSPPRPRVRLPSQGASVVGQSARTEPARESPSRRFFASPDQIDALGTPRTWVHGQVISTLGDTFCYTSHSKPRHERYEVLPTNLFDLWNSSMEGHIASGTGLSFHFKQAASPLECRAWLIPVLLEHHWYLLTFDWIDHAIRICDSLAIPHPRLVEFGCALLILIAECFDFADQDWVVVPEQCGPRQKNDYDCGIYVLWDIYCLSYHGATLPRSISAEEITGWRPTLYSCIQLLDPYKPKRNWPLETLPSAGSVINIDSD